MFRWQKWTAVLLLTVAAAPATARAANLDPPDVVRAFAAHGLDINTSEQMTDADFGLAKDGPGWRVGVHFTLHGCGGCGGRVMLFQTTAGRRAQQRYYVRLGQASPQLRSWVWARGRGLLQLNGHIPRREARRYRAVFMGAIPDSSD